MGSGQTRYLWTSLKLTLVLLFAVFVLAMLVMFAAIGGSNVAGFHTEAGKSVGSTLAFIAIGLAYIALGYYVFRFSLAFPDAALGQGGSISEAWTRTEGNGWRLLIYGLLVQTPSSAITWIGGFVIGVVVKTVLSLAGVATPDLTMKIGMVFILPIMLFQWMVTVTMLSVAYREIVGLPSGMAPAMPDIDGDAQPA